MYTADELRNKQKETAEDITHDDTEVAELTLYIEKCMDKLIEFPAVHEVIVPKDILLKYSRGSILYMVKLLKESYKFNAEYLCSKDMVRSIERLTITW